MTNEIQPADIDTTAKTLDLIAIIQSVPQRIFDKFQFAFGGTSMEVVPIHIDGDGSLKVFMIQRPEKDTYWPNEFHVPGTMVFPWDVFKHFVQDGFSKPWERLKTREFMRDVPHNLINPAGTLHLDTKRGAETAVVHIAVVDDNLPGGQFFRIDDLPKSVINHHLPIIRLGVLTLIGDLKTGQLSIKGVDADKTEKMLEQAHGIIRLKND